VCIPRQFACRGAKRGDGSFVGYTAGGEWASGGSAAAPEFTYGKASMGQDGGAGAFAGEPPCADGGDYSGDSDSGGAVGAKRRSVFLGICTRGTGFAKAVCGGISAATGHTGAAGPAGEPGSAKASESVGGGADPAKPTGAAKAALRPGRASKVYWLGAGYAGPDKTFAGTGAHRGLCVSGLRRNRSVCAHGHGVSPPGR